MADEQTPKSFDDAVDPSESSSLENKPLDAPSEAEAAELAARARSARPKRKRPSMASPQGSENTAKVSAVEDSTDAEAAPVPRPAIPRPVRRNRPDTGATVAIAPEDAEEPSRNPVVAAPRKRETTPAVAERKRTTPAAFVGQSADELRKVIWPTRQQLTTYFLVVLAFVLFIVAYVGGLDLFFGWLLLKLFGK